MDATQIIEKLGGRQVVAEITGTTPNVVTQWRRIGIPAKYWPEIMTRARAKRLSGITFDVLRASKRAGGKG